MKRAFVYLGMTLLVALIVWAFERPDRTPRGDTQEEAFFPDFDANTIESIEGIQLSQGVQLERDGDSWKVAPRGTSDWNPADSNRVKQVLGIFGDLSRGLLVSSNREKQSLYHVGEEGLTIRLIDRAGKERVGMIIGKNSPDLLGTYVRHSGEDDVYLVDRALTGLFSISADDWKQSPPKN